MDSEKQLEKLKTIIDVLDTDRASVDETAEAFQAVLEIIKQLKDQIDQEMRQNKGEMDDLFTGVVAELKKLENRILKVSDRLEAKMTVDNNSIRKQLLSEVNSLRDLIPQLPDLSKLENRMEEIAKSIPKIPDELTPTQIRDSLETLQKEDRLDVRAVNGAPKITVSSTPPRDAQIGDLWASP